MTTADLRLPHTAAESRKLAIWISLGTLVFLVFLMPFAYGHGFERKSLATVVYRIANELEDWQHCLYVPFIAVFLVYLRRAYLATIPIQGSVLGLGLVIFSLALYWLGYKAETQYIGFAAIQLLIAGIVIWLLGWRFFYAMIFPWLFITFAWPLVFLDGWLTLYLRIAMTDISYQFLNLIGLDAIRRGTAILSAPDFQNGIAEGQIFSVDIADPCSGIRSLFALMMLCALYGYVAMPRVWQHMLIFACSVPLAILGNFIRILLLTFGILGFGSDFAIGSHDHPSTYHMFAGFAVFAVAIVGMIGIGRLLKMIDPGPPSPDDENGGDKPNEVPAKPAAA